MMTIPVILTIIYYFNHLGDLSNNGDNLIIIGTSIYTLFGLGLMIYGFIDFYLDVYIVTDRRIVDIKQDGFFKRAISELNFRQIQDVNAKVNGVSRPFFIMVTYLFRQRGSSRISIFSQSLIPMRCQKSS
jgi:hypothetical protein